MKMKVVAAEVDVIRGVRSYRQTAQSGKSCLRRQIDVFITTCVLDRDFDLARAILPRGLVVTHHFGSDGLELIRAPNQFIDGMAMQNSRSTLLYNELGKIRRFRPHFFLHFFLP